MAGEGKVLERGKCCVSKDYARPTKRGLHRSNGVARNRPGSRANRRRRRRSIAPSRMVGVRRGKAVTREKGFVAARINTKVEVQKEAASKGAVNGIDCYM